MSVCHCKGCIQLERRVRAGQKPLSPNVTFGCCWARGQRRTRARCSRCHCSLSTSPRDAAVMAGCSGSREAAWAMMKHVGQRKRAESEQKKREPRCRSNAVPPIRKLHAVGLRASEPQSQQAQHQTHRPEHVETVNQWAPGKLSNGTADVVNSI